MVSRVDKWKSNRNIELNEGKFSLNYSWYNVYRRIEGGGVRILTLSIWENFFLNFGGVHQSFLNWIFVLSESAGKCLYENSENSL